MNDHFDLISLVKKEYRLMQAQKLKELYFVFIENKNVPVMLIFLSHFLFASSFIGFLLVFHPIFLAPISISLLTSFYLFFCCINAPRILDFKIKDEKTKYKDVYHFSLILSGMFTFLTIFCGFVLAFISSKILNIEVSVFFAYEMFFGQLVLFLSSFFYLKKFEKHITNEFRIYKNENINEYIEETKNEIKNKIDISLVDYQIESSKNINEHIQLMPFLYRIQDELLDKNGYNSIVDYKKSLLKTKKIKIKTS